LTAPPFHIKLDKQNRSSPDPRESAAIPLFSPLGWEIVQLVGLQTLDLAILVRVQVSQPKFFSIATRPLTDTVLYFNDPFIQ
jgi:hypothetical protein